MLVVADIHGGHCSGLTHPDYWTNETDGFRGKLQKYREAIWNWWIERINYWKPDIVLHNGDAIDGKGNKSGGSELLTADRIEQVNIAAKALEETNAKEFIIVRGTPYHTGQDEDFETILADKLNARKVGAHEWLNIEGVIFDIKHKAGRSSIPHGRSTPLRRALLWNRLWSIKGLQPKADVLLRSHNHYFEYSGDASAIAIGTPAMQGWTKFGGLECEGTTDVGFLIFDCEDGKYVWKHDLFDMSKFGAEIVQL